MTMVMTPVGDIILTVGVIWVTTILIDQEEKELTKREEEQSRIQTLEVTEENEPSRKLFVGVPERKPLTTMPKNKVEEKWVLNRGSGVKEMVKFDPIKPVQVQRKEDGDQLVENVVQTRVESD